MLYFLKLSLLGGDLCAVSWSRACEVFYTAPAGCWTHMAYSYRYIIVVKPSVLRSLSCCHACCHAAHLKAMLTLVAVHIACHRPTLTPASNLSLGGDVIIPSDSWRSELGFSWWKAMRSEPRQQISLLHILWIHITTCFILVGWPKLACYWDDWKMVAKSECLEMKKK